MSFDAWIAHAHVSKYIIPSMERLASEPAVERSTCALSCDLHVSATRTDTCARGSPEMFPDEPAFEHFT